MKRKSLSSQSLERRHIVSCRRPNFSDTSAQARACWTQRMQGSFSRHRFRAGARGTRPLRSTRRLGQNVASRRSYLETKITSDYQATLHPNSRSPADSVLPSSQSRRTGLHRIGHRLASLWCNCMFSTIHCQDQGFALGIVFQTSILRSSISRISLSQRAVPRDAVFQWCLRKLSRLRRMLTRLSALALSTDFCFDEASLQKTLNMRICAAILVLDPESDSTKVAFFGSFVRPLAGFQEFVFGHSKELGRLTEVNMLNWCREPERYNAVDVLLAQVRLDCLEIHGHDFHVWKKLIFGIVSASSRWAERNAKPMFQKSLPWKRYRYSRKVVSTHSKSKQAGWDMPTRSLPSGTPRKTTQVQHY